MHIFEIIILILIAAVCGGVGSAIVGYSHGGFIVSLALGFIGALLGMWLARQMDLPELFSIELEGIKFPIVWSIIGAALFAAVISLISGRRRPPTY